MDIETVRRISLARHLYELGTSSLRSSNDLHLFAAANLLQDAVEAFLIAVAENVGAAIDQNTKFDKYFVLIDARIAPKELPFKLKLLRLNRIRVDSKHYGIQPARDECDRVAVSVREFFDEVSTSIFGVSFSMVSAIDLVDDGETRQLLLEARASLEEGDYESCVISCRKALFLEIERRYDIAIFKEAYSLGVLAGSYAPYFAQSKDYVEKNVRNPTDFIVLDHNRLDQELLTQGVDPTAFWNVWRLTPEVYRTKNGKWIIKHDFHKLDSRVLEDKVAYIFSTTIDVVLAIHTTRKAIKTANRGSYYLELAQANVPIFEKADTKSKVIGNTPAGIGRIDTDFRILGFEGDGPYWHIHHIEGDVMLWGYIHNDYVK
jgi:hypothetical protein